MKKQTTQQICREVRKQANKWTPEYRALMFKKGMEIVNGGKKEHYSGVCMTLSEPTTEKEGK